MKNSGFTLIELIAVIAILGILGTVITVSLTKNLSNTNEKGCNDFVNEVEDAGCVYAALEEQITPCNRNNCQPIKLDILIKSGLIKSETDACTNKSIDKNATVSVTWNASGEKICHYNGVREYEG